MRQPPRSWRVRPPAPLDRGRTGPGDRGRGARQRDSTRSGAQPGWAPGAPPPLPIDLAGSSSSASANPHRCRPAAGPAPVHPLDGGEEIRSRGSPSVRRPTRTRLCASYQAAFAPWRASFRLIPWRRQNRRNAERAPGVVARGCDCARKEHVLRTQIADPADAARRGERPGPSGGRPSLGIRVHGRADPQTALVRGGRGWRLGRMPSHPEPLRRLLLRRGLQWRRMRLPVHLPHPLIRANAPCAPATRRG